MLKLRIILKKKVNYIPEAAFGVPFALACRFDTSSAILEAAGSSLDE